jgi:putative hydrolase of the HAD superfamily
VVVFDLGGVVVRICRTWEEACAAAGVPHRPDAAARLAGDAAHRVVDEHQCGRIPCEQFYERMARLMDGAYSPDEVRAIHHAWTREDYPGIADVVDTLHVAGVDTACLSNTNASHWEILRTSPALARIRHRHASHILGLAKPDPAIYRAFEEETGFAPREILFFDDLEEHVTAARARGWRAHQVDHRGDTAGQVLAALRGAGVPV